MTTNTIHNLYLLPTFLADIPYKEIIPEGNIEKVLNCKCFIVEEIRTARRFLRKIGYKRDFEEVKFFILNEHTLDGEIENFLLPLENENIFLMSESGLPCVADPGAKVVALAQRRNFKVVPLVGASSIYLSLMASGMNGQNFAFVGYLPVKDEEREKRLRELEHRSKIEHQTQIFIETPYRNDKLFASMKKILNGNTLLCIASNVTAENETIITKPIVDWKKENDFIIGKQNTIFLIFN